MKILFLAPLTVAVILIGCSKNNGVPSAYAKKIAAHHAEIDSFMRFDPASPFKRDTTVHYHALNYFPPDSTFRFASKLYRYPVPEIVTVMGTKGEERKEIKYGYFQFEYNNKQYRLNVYKFTKEELQKRGTDLKDYLMVWFRDETTGKETYPVGRYVDVDRESPDTNYVYVLDFNYAYNPYCAYSSLYSCAVPRNDDVLDFAVRAGEKKYHE
jgi:uncharacterized protein